MEKVKRQRKVQLILMVKKIEDKNVSDTKGAPLISTVIPRTLQSQTINSEIPADPNSSQETQSTEEIEDIFQCKICDQTFKKPLEIKKHKLTCTKLGNKYSCEVCGKGFMQKSYCDQHFDFYHTKKFVCTMCEKSFPLKKTLE